VEVPTYRNARRLLERARRLDRRDTSPVAGARRPVGTA